MKKTIAISMSTVLLMNAAPVFALETVKPGTVPAQGAMAGVTPAATEETTLEKAEVSAADKAAALKELLAQTPKGKKAAELLDVAIDSGNQLYVEIQSTITSFKTQQEALNKEKDPVLRGMLNVQVWLGLANAIAIGAEKEGAKFGKTRVWVTSLSTLMNGGTDLYRQVTEAFGSNADAAKKNALKETIATIQKQIAEDEGTLPREAKDFSLALGSMLQDLDKAANTSSMADKAGMAKWASSLAVVVYLGAHIMAPKAVKAGEDLLAKSGKVSGAIKNRVTTTGAGYTTGIVDYISLALGYNSVEAQKLMEQVQKNLNTAIASYDEISKTKLAAVKEIKELQKQLKK